MLTLYYAKGTAALPVHILLEEIGADYEARLIDFSTAEQTSPDYLAINPKGRVPALVTPGGTLTEVPAILTYLAQTFPDANLAPTNPFGFADALAFACYLSSTVHVNHAHMRRGSRWSDDPAAHESMKAKTPETMTASAALIEEHYLKGPWVLGDTYSFCDPYLYLIARWLPADGVDIEKFPKIKAHGEAVAARPGVGKIIELHG